MKLTSLLDKLKQQSIPKYVAVAQAADKEVLKAVKHAVKLNLASFILFGDKQKIVENAKEVALDLANTSIVHTETVQEAAQKAVQSVHYKKAQVLMKGNVPTSVLLKEVLHKEYGLRTGRILSHVALFEVPNQDRFIFVTDAAMNIEPGIKEKAQIIQNAVHVAKKVGVHVPKVAALAAVEVVNPSMQATVDAALLTQMQKRGQITDCIVDGPLAFDNAVSSKAALDKGIESEVAGNADILLVPEIEVGNALYKSFIYFANAKVAAVVSGASAPIVLTSRADSHESKLYSLILSLLTTVEN